MAKEAKKPKAKLVQALQKKLDKFYKTPEGYAQQLRLDVACIVHRRLLELNWSPTDVDQRTGLNPGTVSDIRYGYLDFNTRTIATIGHALGLNIELRPGARAR